MRKHITRLDDATIEQLLGAEDAENETDERFRQYFYFNKIFDNLNNDLPIRILVGHKGIGKSALLRRAYIGDRDRGRVAVSIKPSDLTEHRTATETSDFNLLVEQWKQGLLASIAAKIVEEVTKEHLSKTEALGAAKGVSGFLMRVAKLVLKHTNQRVDASSLVVGTFQEKSLVHVYIDDIDRGWAASPSDIRNISALLNAIRDLSGAEQRIRFRIGLRSDVYFLVRTSDESTDKIERNVIWLNWTNHEILCVVAKRIETFFESNKTQAAILKMTQSSISREILSKIMQPMFQGRNHWENVPVHIVLLSLTRQRPRDLVKLMYAAAKNAFQNGRIIISTADLENAFVSYSAERLQDIINEFKSELPQIDRLLFSLKPLRKGDKAADNYLFTTDRLVARLKSIQQKHSIVVQE